MATQNDTSNIAIADSSVLVSIFLPNDAYHEHAVELARQAEEQGTTVVTPEAVFVETVNILGKKLGHQVAIEAAELMVDSEAFLIVDSSDLLPDALGKFKKSAEKVSMTDCVVMATADRYNTRQILGFDADFRDCGYLAPVPLHKP